VRNDRARFSVLFAVLSLAAVPAAAYASHSKHIDIPQAVAGEAIAGTLLGLLAVLTARGARQRARWSLARPGESAARWGRWLGWLGVCLGLTAAASLAFYAILLAFE
jgi:drug/metabolite transporter (DMT)-like permease